MKLQHKRIVLKHGAWLITSLLTFVATSLAAVPRQTQDDLDKKVFTLTSQDMPALHQRALSGDAMSQYLFGRSLHLGWKLAKDYSQAADWYRKAAEQSYAPAQLMLFEMYSEGEGVPKDPEAAFKWLRKAAEGGFASAQFSLGLSFAHKVGRKHNILCLLSECFYN